MKTKKDGKRKEGLARRFQAFLHPANALKDSAFPGKKETGLFSSAPALASSLVAGKKETCLFLQAAFCILPFS
jgi:hypothetical protein